MKNLRSFLTVCLFLAVLAVSAQNTGDFQRLYLDGKNALKAEDYGLAMEKFQAATADHEDNIFKPYAHYFYGIAAKKAGAYEDANFMVYKLISQYPDWEQIDEARYLYTDIAFASGDYKKGLKSLDLIESKPLIKEAKNLKKHYLYQLKDVDSLKSLNFLYPDDELIAQALADKLLVSPDDKLNKLWLRYLIQDYGFSKDVYDKYALRETVKKDTYNIAVILPFMTDNLERPSQSDWSSKYLEMYEGIKIAADSLAKEGIHVKLFPYDSKKDSATTATILKNPEMLNMDLFIGPVYPQTSTLVSDFCGNYQITYVNMLYSKSDILYNENFTFLSTPTEIEEAKATFEFIADSVDTGKVVILTGKDQDEMQFASFLDTLFLQDSIKPMVRHYDRKNINELEKVFKHFKNSDDTVACILAYSDDDLFGAQLVSYLEQYDLKCPVVAPYSWTEIEVISFEQFIRRNIYFIGTGFIDLNNSKVQAFRKKFEQRMNMKPLLSDYAHQGFESMYFFGGVLNNYGNVFIQELQEQGYTPSGTSYGFDYSESNANRAVPILHVSDMFQMQWVNAEKLTKLK